MDQFTRRIIGFGVHGGIVDGVALCRMFQRAIRGHSLPKYLSSDHDPFYQFHQWQVNLRVLEIAEIKTIPYVPLSHPFVERLIGTIRREYLDRTLFWTTADLETKLFDFQHYYSGHRTHAGLNGRLPESAADEPTSISLDSYRWRRHCRGLYQTRWKHNSSIRHQHLLVRSRTGQSEDGGELAGFDRLRFLPNVFGNARAGPMVIEFLSVSKTMLAADSLREFLCVGADQTCN